MVSSSISNEDNWLHGERIECPHCHQLLYRVDHSPFYDEHFLYCDRCPIHVEVSYYDPEYKQIMQTSRQGLDDYVALMQAIEEHLQPCVCGGTFSHNAPRRCFSCHTAVLLDDTVGIDLLPGDDLLSNEANATESDLEKEERWRAQFVRTKDIWHDLYH